MTKSEVQTILAKHDEEITQLKASTAQMLLIWKLVGATALVALVAFITDVHAV